MSDKLSAEAISRRRALSMLGLAGALGLAPASLIQSEADAQEAATPPATPAPAASTGVGTPGMKRRQTRRAGRHERREERRTGRHERRHERRTGQPAPPAPTPTQ
jgi:hypothetical protein